MSWFKVIIWVIGTFMCVGVIGIVSCAILALCGYSKFVVLYVLVNGGILSMCIGAFIFIGLALGLPIYIVYTD